MADERRHYDMACSVPWLWAAVVDCAGAVSGKAGAGCRQSGREHLPIVSRAIFLCGIADNVRSGSIPYLLLTERAFTFGGEVGDTSSWALGPARWPSHLSGA